MRTTDAQARPRSRSECGGAEGAPRLRAGIADALPYGMRAWIRAGASHAASEATCTPRTRTRFETVCWIAHEGDDELASLLSHGLRATVVTPPSTASVLDRFEPAVETPHARVPLLRNARDSIHSPASRAVLVTR